MFFESKVAVARITAFLLAPELDSQPERLAACDAAANNDSGNQYQLCAIEIVNASFGWEAAASQSARADAGSVAGQSSSASGGAPPGSLWHVNPIANITHASASTNVLSNVSLSLPRGALCAVIGAVGSGKSTLLAGLLGELKRSAGCVRLRGRVGFCAQQAWIQNASLRDNVLFGAAFDRRRYERAIEQCALMHDLDVLLVWRHVAALVLSSIYIYDELMEFMFQSSSRFSCLGMECFGTEIFSFFLLQDGDLTEIGEKGINLSGGQKARVNLARAVYYDADIVLLDDPLSV